MFSIHVPVTTGGSISFAESIERVPDNLELLHGIAAVARLKNDIETAETRYRQILKIAPDDRVAYFNLGYLHSEKGGIDRGGKR